MLRHRFQIVNIQQQALKLLKYKIIIQKKKLLKTIIISCIMNKVLDIFPFE